MAIFVLYSAVVKSNSICLREGRLCGADVTVFKHRMGKDYSSPFTGNITALSAHHIGLLAGKSPGSLDATAQMHQL